MVVLVMGVAGSGKTLIGSGLAEALGWEFVEADTLHPATNIEKMSGGVPLTDSDREPWLRAVREAVEGRVRSDKNVVLACSALKQNYREYLASGIELRIVYLKGSFGVIHERLASRPAHFMKSEMLTSQFADLEEPTDAIVIDISQSPEKMIEAITAKLLV